MNNASDEEDADIIMCNLTTYRRTGRVPEPPGIARRIQKERKDKVKENNQIEDPLIVNTEQKPPKDNELQ